MEIYCVCGEPWDNYHMRFDAIQETDLPDKVKKDWDGKLTPIIEAAFERDGWRFVSHNMYAISQCPACKNNPQNKTKEGREKVAMRQALVEVLGDDSDGLISELNDMESMGL